MSWRLVSSFEASDVFTSQAVTLYVDFLYSDRCDSAHAVPEPTEMRVRMSDGQCLRIVQPGLYEDRLNRRRYRSDFKLSAFK